VFKVTLITLLIATSGCAKQNYQVLAADQAGLILDHRKIVFDATVISASVTLKPSLSNYIFFFIPAGVSMDNAEYSASLHIDVLRKGDPGVSVFEIHNYRKMTHEEIALFPDQYGMHNNSRIRVGYDENLFGRWRQLAIAPFGNVPGWEHRSLGSITIP